MKCKVNPVEARAIRALQKSQKEREIALCYERAGYKQPKKVRRREPHTTAMGEALNAAFLLS